VADWRLAWASEDRRCFGFAAQVEGVSYFLREQKGGWRGSKQEARGWRSRRTIGMELGRVDGGD